MANKYSRYTLQPYVSQYVNPYSVEVNTILRERWDTNKANKDKVDAVLGAWNTLPGDAHHVDKAKLQTKDKLNRFIEYGNYEDAGIAIGEVMADLEGDKGLKASKQSWDVRQQELSWMREMTVKKGIKFLDFGRDKINAHSSYYQDQDGNFVTNIYQPTNEPEHDYDAAMSSMLKTIKADWSGVSRSKADAVAEGLIPTYLNSTEGDQDYRQLTQIDGMSHEDAIDNIRGRLQSFTDQYIHTTKAAAQLNAGTKTSGIGAMPQRYVARKQDMGVADYVNDVLSNNGDVFRDGVNANTTKISKDTQKVINNIAKSALSPDEYKKYKANTYEYYKGHPEFAAYVQYATTNTYQPTFAADDDYDWERAGAAATVGGVGTAAAMTGLAIFGTANAWNPVGWGILGTLALGTAIGFGVDAVMQGGEMATSQKGNVRDWNNTNQGDGAVWGLFDSQAEELEENLEDVDHINKILGTNYENGDPVYEQLKKNALATLRYKQEFGGDEAEKIINDYNGPIFEAETWAPDYNNKEVISALERIEKSWLVTDFDILGHTEESPDWNEMLDNPDTKKVEGVGDADMRFIGIVAPSHIDDTEMMIRATINGKEVLMSPKKANPFYMNLEERIAYDLNKADFIVLDRAREAINDAELNGGGSGEGGQMTGNDLVVTLTELYENILGYNNDDAAAEAELHVFESFNTANPALRSQIVYQMYGANATYEQLTTEQKQNVDTSLTQYYDTYKNGLVRP